MKSVHTPSNRVCVVTHTQRNGSHCHSKQTQIWDRQTHQINIRHWLSALPSLTVFPHSYLYNHPPFLHSSLFNHLLFIPYPNILTHTSRTTTTTHFQQIHREYLPIHSDITDYPLIFFSCCLLCVLWPHILSHSV